MTDARQERWDCGEYTEEERRWSDVLNNCNGIEFYHLAAIDELKRQGVDFVIDARQEWIKGLTDEQIARIGCDDCPSYEEVRAALLTLADRSRGKSGPEDATGVPQEDGGHDD